ncbi:hypothetical protein [Azospirillum brasilense]|uniref:hypothetical protein n=1 Tax=Azospirillum brasilense TaxID=192 RepID=UPI000E68249F|nr:hypothetical protein [Azospirillum brasilense]NUB24315.1 hypothetical protein [Azospirillum brasilense]NUB34113.1 hypothetical protein [Azospirillum brasilense]RIW00998.1 hypothetical protein D2T81_19500 [Azospirillum brasilense]
MRLLFAVAVLASMIVPAAAADKESLAREILKIRSAVEIGTDKQEMTALAKSLAVEFSMAKRSKAITQQIEASTSNLATTIALTVRYWDICPEITWDNGYMNCQRDADTFFRAINSSRTAYTDPHLPWKPFASYVLPEILERSDKALADLK